MVPGASSKSARRVVNSPGVDTASAIRYADDNIAPDVLASEFADVIDLRPAGVSVDRGVDLYLTQRATRSSRVAVLVGDGLETEGILPIVARVENDEALLDGLSASERLSYNQARDAGYTEDQALAVGRWNDPALADAAAACRVANSFSGDTLVAFADGTSVQIADVRVGDQVQALRLPSANISPSRHSGHTPFVRSLP